MRILLLLFVIVPILEMVVLIKVGGIIGALPTIALVCLTAVIGASLIRQQGFSTLQRAQVRAARGELPAQEMLDGMCLAAGGALLLTPGFITDAFGFTLLIPGLRRVLFQHVFNALLVKFQAGFRPGFQSGPGTPKGASADTRTIEGEFQRDDHSARPK